MKKIILVSHCILNTASKVVMYNLKEIEEEEALRKQFVKTALDRGIQLLQLPCPEFTLYGSKRWGHVSEQFDNVFFKKHCRNILLPIIEQLVEYKENKERFQILGIVGIDGSPSCGVDYTCTGEKSYGALGDRDESIMEVIHNTSLCKRKGIFFQVLEEMLVEFKLADIKVEGLFALEPHKCMNLLS
ncbi:hypothetical protein CS063_15245 [Sporanaerobium hydrogeniformans]|uniref:Uncharacterized protein n=1 Tax=Sporanaerobium hydrogeniformans TaxID=3072179 RepID=A0AC61D9M9_9FIRM|nr:CD3072 family TudS-related putative desulfidase [Sporanaerobium hydrogeniformans]PHV69530.1 hypothetical protein CS063_15245 [Sporanaerobium hydrogeniformans]